MSGLTQKDKLISITSPLGEDVLLLQSFSGSEYISKPFQFHLEILSGNEGIVARDLIGKTVDINILLADRSSKRVINGHVSRFVAGPIHENGYRIYQAEIVPWFYLLKLYSDCRIFQNVTVKDIIEQVFSSRGFSDFSISLSGQYRTREYCVQYRETDFQFVSRLMEEEGICYFFTHDVGVHTLHIIDAVNAYKECTEKEARYFEAGRTDDHLTRWEHQYGIIPGKWSQRDYNFKTPSTDISTSVVTTVKLPDINKYEQYDYPGLYLTRDEGNSLTTVRIEEEETSYETVVSSGSYRTFSAGCKFKLGLHEITSEAGLEYVITAISHFARESSYIMNDTGASEYHNDFECIPSSVKYRPRRVTAKPFVQGPQTAVVVGPSGEEIYVDEFGRIKVQFHWDRAGKKDENSSCWLRVSQQWAGKNWGAIFTPRIGHEVVVSFLEGDPDQPLVTGCVYNAENMPPYDLPTNKTQSGWKTRSTTGGGAANFNEIRFEDKKGSEELYIHAEKNQNNKVENDETTSVGHDRTEDVGNNETITIGKDQSITIGANRTESVGADETITIGANRTESVGKSETVSIGENRTESVGGNESVDVGGSQSINIGGDQSENIGKSLALAISNDRGTDVGKNDSLSVGKKLTIEAGDEITLKTGSASIIMKKDGTITIKGKDITLNGSGKINIKASADVIIKGSKIAQN